MLLQKTTIEPGKIIGLKLVNGDELIAKLKRDEMLELTFETPFLMQLVPTPNGMTVAMIPWTFAMDEKSITISKSHILSWGLATEEPRKAYVEKTSNLKIAKSLPEGLLQP